MFLALTRILKASALFIFWGCLGLISCTTHPHPQGHGEYHRIIENHTAGDKQFSGLYHNFEFRGTILTQEVSQAIHHRMGRFYDWSEKEAQEKLHQRMGELAESTKVWLSFFTPERRNDNMAHKKSIWKIYLYVNGKRYEGRARKANMNFEEAKALFAYHSRWATPYFLEFPLPTALIQGVSLRLVITGPMGPPGSPVPLLNAG